MKKAKKWLIISLIFLGLLAFSAVYFRPLPVAIYSESTVILIGRFNEETRQLESIIDLVDSEQIVEILSRYTFVRIPYASPRAFLTGDIQWEIMIQRRPSVTDRVTVILGYTDYMHRSTNRSSNAYRIQNVELLIYEINALFEF